MEARARPGHDLSPDQKLESELLTSRLSRLGLIYRVGRSLSPQTGLEVGMAITGAERRMIGAFAIWLLLVACVPSGTASVARPDDGPLTQVAVAPIFIRETSNYYTSIYFFNASSRRIHAGVEFMRFPERLSVSLGPGESRVESSEEFLPQNPDEWGHDVAWLRHDGDRPDDVRASVVVVNSLAAPERSFSVPFQCARPQEAGTGDNQRTLVALLAPRGRTDFLELGLANLGDTFAEVDVEMRIECESGISASDDPQVLHVNLDAGRSTIYDLNHFLSNLPEQGFGSITVRTTSAFVVAHAAGLRRDPPDGSGDSEYYDLELVDPSLSVSNTKLLAPVVFDPEAASVVYVSARNMSHDSSQTATITIPAPSGPLSKQIALAASEERVVSFDARELTPDEERFVSTVTVVHDGAPVDVVACALTVNSEDLQAIPARAVSAPPANAARLVCPYLQNVSGFAANLIVSNFGDEAATVGVRMVSADKGAKPVTTVPIVVPPHSSVVEDLAGYRDALPARYSQVGAIELLPIRGGSSVGAVLLTELRWIRIGGTLDRIYFAQCTRLDPVEGLGVGEDVLVFPNHLLAVPSDDYPLTFVTHGGPPPRLKIGQGFGHVTVPESAPGGTYESVYRSPDGIPSHKFKIHATSSATGERLAGATVVVYLYEFYLPRSGTP